MVVELRKEVKIGFKMKDDKKECRMTSEKCCHSPRIRGEATQWVDARGCQQL